MINNVRERNAMPEQDINVRLTNFDEVALGYTEADAIREAMRCLKCRKKRIVKFLSGCEILRRKDLGRDPCLLRPLERIHARVVGNHTDNLCSVNASIRNPVNDCLQVCAAA